MKKEQNIESVFQDKLLDLESPVDGKLWNQVAQKANIQNGFWSIGKVASLLLFIGVASWGGFMFLSDSSDYSSPEVSEEIQAEQPLILEKPAIQDSNPQKENVAVSKPIKPTLQESRKTEVKKPAPSEPSPDIELEPIKVKETRNAQYDLKPIARNTDIKNDEVEPKVEEEISKDQVVSDSKPPVFEQANRLDLGTLYAPEKKPEQTRENIHLPGPYPKIFNPNLPGDAGTFSVPTLNIGYFKVMIKSQRGLLVFHSMDPNFVWRGEMLDGSLAPEGNYIYIIEASDADGVPLKPQSGAVFLMRK